MRSPPESHDLSTLLCPPRSSQGRFAACHTNIPRGALVHAPNCDGPRRA
jgi:hypothetical protein